MNAAQRRERDFDQAADQAHNEGVSSFGIGFNRMTDRQLEVYRNAAEERGCRFEVDVDGAGLFIED